MEANPYLILPILRCSSVGGCGTFSRSFLENEMEELLRH